VTPVLAALATAMLAAAPPGPMVRAALERALAVPGARLEVLSIQAPGDDGCAVESAEALGMVRGSGRATVRLTGRMASGAGCASAVFAAVRVTAPAWVLTRPVRTGEPLAGAARLEEREVRPGHLPVATLSAETTVARPLAGGTVLEAEHLAPAGPAPGAEVEVVVNARGLVLQQSGRAVPCSRGRACALLPSGTRVEGSWTDGRLLVEVR